MPVTNAECPRLYCLRMDAAPTRHGEYLEVKITYYQWNAENKKAQVQSTLVKAAEELITHVVALKRHCYDAKVQLQQIKQLKSSLAENGSSFARRLLQKFSYKRAR